MKIDILDVTMKNFLSVGNSPITVDFREGMYRVNGMNKDTNDPNGVGKSAIFTDSLMFGLFGQPVRNIKKCDIPNTINGKKKCEVSLNFKVNDKDLYQIVRTIKPDGLSFFKNGEPVQEQCSVKLKQLEINAILQSDYSTFSHLLIMTKSYTKPFLEMDTTGKRKIIEDILGVNIFGKMREYIKKDIEKDMNGDIKINQKEYEIGHNNLESIEMRYLQIKTKSEAFESDRKQKIAELKTLLENTKTKIETYKSEIIEDEELKKKLKDIRTISNKLSEKSIEIKTKVRSNKESISELSPKLKELRENPTCPLCKTETNSDHVQEHISELESKIETMQSLIDTSTEKISSIKMKSNEYEDKYEQIEDDIDKNRQRIIKLDALKEKNVELKEKTRDVLKSKNEFSELLEDNEIKVKHDELKVIEEKLNELQTNKKYYDYIKKLLSEEGIKNYIIKNILPFWNAKVNHYLKELSANFTIEFDEKLDAIVKSRGRDELTYHSFSGGERSRIDVSILTSFLDLAKLRNSIDLNVIILDELLDGSGLSSNGKESALEIFKRKAELEKKSVYVITHDSSVPTDLFNKEINLVLESGFTRMLN